MAGDANNLALLHRWSQRLRPSHPLDPAKHAQDGPLYVDLDGRMQGGQHVSLRGASAVVAIVRSLKLAKEGFAESTTHLLTGFRGTGKTTELNRLARELGDLGEFAVLRVSARQYHHLSDSLSIEELAVILAGGIGEAAIELLGESQLEPLKREGVWNRIHGSLERAFEGSSVSLGFVSVQLKAALRQGEGLKANLRQALRERPNQLQTFLHDFVREIAAAIHPRQLVILVDDLEKYNVVASRVAQVYQDMAQLFFHWPELLKLPQCHTIYTIPPYLALINPGIAETYEGRLHLLPSVKVRARPPSRELFQPGIDALEAVLAQRVDLDRLFGGERSECITRLASASGGNLRDLFTLLEDSILAAVDEGLPVGPKQVEDAIQKQAAMRSSFLKGTFEILSEVRERGNLFSIDEARLGDLAAAMDQHLLLCYRNANFWYDVHPFVESALDRGSPGAP